MKKFYAELVGKDRGVLLDADHIAKDESFLYVYNSDVLMGMFDLGTIVCAYCSEQGKGGNAS